MFALELLKFPERYSKPKYFKVSSVVFKVCKIENYELSFSIERVAPATEAALQFNSIELISLHFSSDLYCYLAGTTVILSVTERERTKEDTVRNNPQMKIEKTDGMCRR